MTIESLHLLILRRGWECLCTKDGCILLGERTIHFMVVGSSNLCRKECIDAEDPKEYPGTAQLSF